MGIKEYFEKRGVGDLRLQDMDLEIEKSEQKIAWEDLVEEDDFERLVKKYAHLGIETWKEMRGTRISETFIYPDTDALEEFARLKIVFPERFEELGIGRDVFERIKQNFENLQKREIRREGQYMLKDMALIKILFPNWSKEIDFNLEEYAEEIKHDIDTDKVLGAGARACYILFDLAILYPEKLEEFGLDDKLFEKVKERLDFGSWFMFMEKAVCLRVLFPEGFKKLKLKNNEQMWGKVKKALEQQRDPKRTVGDLGILLRGAKVILADEVKLNEKGLELIMKKSELKVKGKTRPERLKF